MKKKLSVSIEEGTIDKLDEFVEEGSFRNKSHLVEVAINRLIKQNGDKQNDRLQRTTTE